MDYVSVDAEKLLDDLLVVLENQNRKGKRQQCSRSFYSEKKFEKRLRIRESRLSL